MRRASYWIICAIAFIAGGVPWYTLRMLPLLTIGSAKVNVLDVLVGLATLLGAIRALRPWRGMTTLAWLSVAFSGYMLLRLIVSLPRPEDAFYAIRELRPLTFYLLAVPLAVFAFTLHEYQRFLSFWLTGTGFGIMLSLLHACQGVPIPGYALDAAFAIGSRVQYLEWTSLPIAAVIATEGMLTRSGVWRKVLFALVLLGLIWFNLVLASRAVQLVTVLAVIAVGLALRGDARLKAITLGGLTITAALTFASWGTVPCVGAALTTTTKRWSEVGIDRSLAVRVEEITGGLQVVPDAPIFGIGLGTSTPVPLDADPSGMARNIASGYAFLLFKTGIVGLTLYLAILWTAARNAWRSARLLHPGSVGHTLSWTTLIGIFVLVLFNLVHRVAGIPEGAIALALFGWFSHVNERTSQT